MAGPLPLTPPSPEDDDRFRKVLEDYGRLLRAAIARHCPPDLAAEHDDIRQDATIRLWKALSSGREIPSLASYVYRVAATATIDAIRRVKARREDALGVEGSAGDAPGPAPLPAAGRTPEESAAAGELVAAVERVRRTLLPDRARAVGLHLKGFTTTEIGDLLGWTEARARNLVYRGLNDLRRKLREEGVEYDGERI